MSPCATPRRSRAPLEAGGTAGRLEMALEHLRADGAVAFPSETVWGLAARASSQRAVDALRAWKGRGSDRPISLLVSGEAALAAHGFELSPLARRLVDALWPGPLTLVLPCRARFARGVASPSGSVGVRCSSHPLAAALASAAEAAGLGLLTATSLNRSGDAPVGCEAEARALCAAAPGGPRVIGAGGDDAGGEPPTTVVDLAGDRPRVIRWGGVGAQVLEPLLGSDLDIDRGDPNG